MVKTWLYPSKGDCSWWKNHVKRSLASIYEALMGETVQGKGGEGAEDLFWHENKCLWTDQKYPCAAAQMVSNQWSIDAFGEPPRMQSGKRHLTGFRRPPYDIGCGSGGLDTYNEWSSFQTWKLTNTLLCPSSARASELRRSCMREACAATGCAVLVWRVVRELHMQTRMNYNKH